MLTQVLDEWNEDSRAPSDYLNTLNRQARRNPFADSSFLRVAFLEGCHKAGILAAISRDQLNRSNGEADCG